MKPERHNGMDPRSLRLAPDGDRYRERGPVDDRPVREAVSAEVVEMAERRRVARMLTGTSHMGSPENTRGGRPKNIAAPLRKVRAYALPDGTCNVCGDRVTFGCEHLESAE